MAPIYCKTCKLVFHQKRIEHNASEMHRLINDFLNPRCSVCDTDYFSPMAYERHIATLQHIRVWLTDLDILGDILAKLSE